MKILPGTFFSRASVRWPCSIISGAPGSSSTHSRSLSGFCIAPIPCPLPPLFQSLLETGGGGLTTGGGVFGAVERASNGSPAGSWGRSASPRRATSSSNNIWGAGEGWEHAAPSRVPQSTPGLGGWDHAPNLAEGAQLVPQHATHSTNPFGTSPSNPPTYHAPGDLCAISNSILRNI